MSVSLHTHIYTNTSSQHWDTKTEKKSGHQRHLNNSRGKVEHCWNIGHLLKCEDYMVQSLNMSLAASEPDVGSHSNSKQTKRISPINESLDEHRTWPPDTVKCYENLWAVIESVYALICVLPMPSQACLKLTLLADTKVCVGRRGFPACCWEGGNVSVEWAWLW